MSRLTWSLALAACALALGAVLLRGRAATGESVRPGNEGMRTGPGEEARLVAVVQEQEAWATREAVTDLLSPDDLVLGPPSTIEVRDARSTAPVPGAAISFTLEAGSLPLGVTDEAGDLVARLPVVYGGEGWILAEAESHASKQVLLSQPNPASVRIHLERSGPIRGIVTGAGGGTVGAGFLVVAWPATQPLRRASDVRAIERRRRSGGFARTGPDGTFVIEGLAEGVLHGLYAGRRGILNVERASATPGTPDAEDVEIVVHPLVGVIVAPRPPAGAQPPDIESLASGLGLYLSVPGHVLEPLFLEEGRTARLAIADVPLDGLELPMSGDYLYLCAWKDADEPPSVQYTLRIPGYVEQTGMAPMRPVVEGAHVHEIALAPDGRGKGTLRVEFLGITEALRSVPERASLELVIQSTSRPEGFRVDVDDLALGRAVDLPPDRYLVSLRANRAAQDFVLEEVKADVIDGEVASVRFDVSDLGSFRLRVWTTAGEEVTGRIKLRTGILEEGGEPARMAMLSFPNAPYRVVGVPPGLYQARISWPADSGALQDAEASIVEVRAGLEGELDLVIPY